MQSSKIVLLAFSALLAYGCERAADSAASTPPAIASSAPAIAAAALPESGASPGDLTAAASQPAPAGPQVVAYYFHRTLRCATCLSIESQARRAIELEYGGELGAGRLEWRSVNFDEPESAHFEKDFELDSQSLVLVAQDGAQVQRWKNLRRVWELVEDPLAFQEYVASEVGAFLGGE